MNECFDLGRTPGGKYNQIRIGGKSHNLHRVIFERAFGPVPSNLVVDHVCNNSRCCNLNHLRVETRGYNVKRAHKGVPKGRRTHCKRGHEFTEENTIWTHGGTRRDCRICNRMRVKKSYYKKRRTLK